MKISPNPSFPKEGKFLPFVKGGEEGFGFSCPYNYALISWRPDGILVVISLDAITWKSG